MFEIKQWCSFLIKVFGIWTTTILMTKGCQKWLGMSDFACVCFWGFACMYIFMDSIVLQHDHQRLHDQFNDLVARHNFMQNTLKELIQQGRERESKLLLEFSAKNKEVEKEIETFVNNLRSLNGMLESFPSSYENTPECFPLQSKNQKIPTLSEECVLAVKRHQTNYVFQVSSIPKHGLGGSSEKVLRTKYEDLTKLRKSRSFSDL